MAPRIVLKFDTPESLADFNVELTDNNQAVMIYNNATDATAWCLTISLTDWERVKDFINKQLTQQNGTQ